MAFLTDHFKIFKNAPMFVMFQITSVQQVSYAMDTHLFPADLEPFLMQSRLKGTSSSPQKRSRIDIIADILGETLKGARKTHIMYKCNLSHNQLHAYLKLLLAMELLGLHSNVYKATAKGLKFLDAYRTLEALMT